MRAIGPISAPVVSAITRTAGLKASGPIHCYAYDEATGILYVGGEFTSFFNETEFYQRSFLAAIDTKINKLTDWAPTTSGPVYSMAKIGNNIYCGGAFYGLAPNDGGTAGGFHVWNTNTTRDNTFAFTSVQGRGTNPLGISNSVSIRSIISDDAGGYYIGGYFRYVNGRFRANLAHINSSGQLTSWNPSSIATVRSMVKYNDNIYIGGEFANLAGTLRNYLAAVNSAGTLLSWNPSADNYVYSLFNDGPNIYIAGDFLSLNGWTRSGFAMVSADGVVSFQRGLGVGIMYTGTKIGDNIYLGTQSFNYGTVSGHSAALADKVTGAAVGTPQLVDGVTICVTSDDLGGAYIGGSFSRFNNLNRNNLVHINSSGEVSTWAPSASSSVNSILKLGDNIYMGGSFSSIDGQARARLAAVNTSGNLLDWDPSADSTVRSLSAIGYNIYLGGDFSSLGIYVRKYLAAVNTSGSVLSWNPSANATVRSIHILGDNIYIGGSLTALGGSTRTRIGAVNTAGTLLSWNPSASARVNSVTSFGDNIYFGGDFTSVSTTGRQYLAAVNTSGNLLSWNPSSSSNVASIVSDGANLYLIGNMTAVGGSAVNRGAAVNTAGSILTWNANTTSTSEGQIAILGTNVYLAGNFSRATRGPVRNGLIAVNTSSSLQSWAPSTNSSVFTMIAIGDNIFIGGAFWSINSMTRNYLALVNTSGSLLSWNPSSNSWIYTLNNDGDNIYIGGELTSISSTSRNYLAAVNTSGSLLSWNPSASYWVQAIKATGNTVAIGMYSSTGSQIGGLAQRGLAAFNTAGQNINWTYGWGSVSYVYAMTAIGVNIYFGGNFGSVGFGVTRNFLAAANTSGSVLSWNPSANLTVYRMAQIGNDKVIIAGDFTSIGSVPKSQVAVINTAGSLQSTNIRFDRIAAIATSDDYSRLYVGGGFAGRFRSFSGVASFDKDGGHVVARNAASDTGTPISLVSDDNGGVYVAGTFTSVYGSTRNRLAHINSSGNLTSWNPNADGEVQSIAKQGDNIYVGGNFLYIGASVRTRFAVINTAGTLLTLNASADNVIQDIHVDGANIYLGGKFTSISATTRNRIAQITTTGTLASWDPNIALLATGGVPTEVNDVLVIGDNVYIAGHFNTVSATERNMVAAVDKSGNLLSWDPSANSTVRQLLRHGTSSNIFVAGSFVRIGGLKRERLAVVNTAGSVQSFDIGVFDTDPDANIRSLALDGDNLYIGGRFDRVWTGGTRSNYGVWSTSGSALPENRLDSYDGISSTVRAMTSDGSGGVFIGGEFSTPRRYVAHINSSGQLTSWNPSSSSAVRALGRIGDNIYIGGNFSTIAGISRTGFAVVNTAGSIQTLNVNLGSSYYVYGMHIIGDNIVISGQFSSVGSARRINAALINTTGSVLDWRLDTESDDHIYTEVWNTRNIGDNIYAVGTFTHINPAGISAAFIRGTSNKPYPSLVPNNLIVEYRSGANGSTSGAILNTNVVASTSDGNGGVYFAGSFSHVNGSPRAGIAHINSSGAVSSWAPAVSLGSVYALERIGSNIYVGGSFTTFEFSSRIGLAAINTSGSLLAWAPTPTGTFVVYDIHAQPGTDNLFVGGSFTAVDGQTRRGAALINTDGAVQAWNPGLSLNATVYSIRTQGSNVWVGGSFTSAVGPAQPSYMAVYDTAQNDIDVFKNTAIDNAVYAITVDSVGGVYIGGSFTTVNGLTRNRLAYINSSGNLTSWNMNASGDVLSLMHYGENIYIGGAFTSVNNTSRRYFAVANTAGSLLSGTPSFSSSINAIKRDGTNIYMAGAFIAVRPSGSGTAIKSTYAYAMNTTGSNLGWKPELFDNGGEIAAITPSGSTVYIGGNIKYGDYHGAGVALVSKTTGASAGAEKTVLDSFPFNGYAEIYTAASDGNGGIYFGGGFNSVNGQPRKNLAQINSLGYLTSWDINVDAEVYCIAPYGDNIYLSGFFTSVSAQSRHYLAAINTSGSLLSWGPSAEYYARSIIPYGSNLYMAGYFWYIDDVARNCLAAIDTDGNLLSWNPDVTSRDEVYSMVRDGDNLYFGGAFTQVAGQIRRYIAGVNTQGTLLTWNPSASSYVYELALDGSNIYVGGNFTYFSGTQRNYLCLVNTSGSLLTWNPSADGRVTTLLVDGANVYIGGTFQNISATPRSNFACVTTDSVLQSWGPGLALETGYNVNRFLVVGDNIFIGGDHPFLGGTQIRSHLAQTNSSGTLTDWAPSTDSFVEAIGVVGDNVYFGGWFTSVNSVERRYLAGVNSSGNLLSWNPSAGNGVTELAINGDNIYISGDFTSISSTARGRTALVNTSGSLLSWGPSANDISQSIVINGSNVYLGGNFTTIGSTVFSANNIVSVNQTGTPLITSINTSATVRAITIVNDNVYFGGDFTTVSASTRQRLAAVNSSGNLLSWNPSADASVVSLDAYGDNIYIAGNFSYIGGVVRPRVTAVNTSGSLTSFAPVPTSVASTPSHIRVYGGTVDGPSIFIGGQLRFIAGQTERRHAASVNTSGSILAWNPSASGYIEAIDVLGDNIYMGGGFTNIGGTTRRYVAGFNTSGALLSWNPSANSSVFAVATLGSNIYLGGFFSRMSNAERSAVAAVNTAGSLLPWNPNASSGSYVVKILADGSNIHVGGIFASMGMAKRDDIAAITTSGAILPWRPAVENTTNGITSMVVTPTQVWAVRAVTPSLIGPSYFADMTSSGVMSEENVSPNNNVYSIVVHNNFVYLSGPFTSIAGTATVNVARFDANTKQLYTYSQPTYPNDDFLTYFGYGTNYPSQLIKTTHSLVTLTFGSNSYGPLGTIYRLSDGQIIN